MKNYLKLLLIITVQMFASEPDANQYGHTSITMLQAVHGAGYLSSGGSDFIDYLFSGIKLHNLRVLDYGSGVCGPSIHIAQKYGAHVDGIEINPFLLARGQENVKNNNLESQISLHLIESATLPIASKSIDVVFSKEVILHVEEKELLFKEFNRVLKPGGMLIISDWLMNQSVSNAKGKPINPTKYSFYGCSLETYKHYLSNAQFDLFEVIDTTNMLLKYVLGEYETISLVAENISATLYGQQAVKDCMSLWKAYIQMIETKEIHPFVFRARKILPEIQNPLNLVESTFIGL